MYYMPVLFHHRMQKLKQSINFLYNSEETQPWVALYEQKRMKWDSDRKEFRWLNGRSMPYPDHLKENMTKYAPTVGLLTKSKRNTVQLVVTRVLKRMH